MGRYGGEGKPVDSDRPWYRISTMTPILYSFSTYCMPDREIEAMSKSI